MVEDYKTGLQALLYLKSRPDLDGWDGQSPPTPRHQVGKPVPSVADVIGKGLPNFGPYAVEKKRGIATAKLGAYPDFTVTSRLATVTSFITRYANVCSRFTLF